MSEARGIDKQNESYNCNKCLKPDSFEDMVECEHCTHWYHYSCVGVTSAISTQKWACENCIRRRNKNLHVTSAKGKSNASGRASRSSKATYVSRNEIEIDLELKKLEMEQALEEKKRERENEILEKERDMERQKEEKERKMLEKEREMLKMNEARDKEILEKRFSLLKQKSIGSDCGGSLKSYVEEKDIFKKVDNWLKPSPKIKIGDPTNIENKENYEFVNSYTKFNNPINYNRNINVPTNLNQHITVPVNYNQQQQFINNADLINQPLTTQQINSRQVISKDLPYFNGRPEEWPLFISEFNMSSEICGFTNIENLSRLRKALKGDALEAVRSRLVLPSNVPNIINTLATLYGNPEIIITTIINKIRTEPAPKYDKFDTVTKYALAVENLCATIESANLMNHLTNPLLLRELVNKLPTELRVNWAMQLEAEPNILLFSIWLTNVSNKLRKVTCNVPTTTMVDIKKNDNRRFNTNKNYVYAHTEEVGNQNFSKKFNQQTDKKKCCICQQLCTSVKNCQKFKDLTLNDKWTAVNKYKLCRICLFPHQGNCNSDKRCGKNNCIRRHNYLLHNDKKDYQDQSQQNKDSQQHQQQISDSNEPSPSVKQYSCTTHQLSNHTVLFRIIPIILYGENCKIETFAFFDEGSSLTLIEQSLADELGLQGPVESLCLRWTANNSRTEEKSQRVNLKISSVNTNTTKYAIANARTVAALNLPTQTLLADELCNKYKYLKGLPITSYEKALPKILIGLDNSKLAASLKIREGDQDEPVAVKTRLGWNIYGPLQNKIIIKNNINFNGLHVCECERSNDDVIQQLVKEYISLENFGVTKPIQDLMSKENERCIRIMESTIQKINNRFEIGLLWKYDEFELPDSLPMAKRRLECLEKKMLREPELATILKQKICEYVDKKYIHKLTEAELNVNYPRVWYLPIFTVTNPNKPGKTRMVWDAAAKVHGVSLNSMLLKGPDQLVSLPAVLHRFRERKIAICGDIREMFHQVRIKKEDQHSQRFLWKNPGEELNIYEMEVMTFGASCSPSCAQYVKNKNASQYIEAYPRAVHAITENHYVDDLLDSLDTEDEAIQLANDVKFIHQQGGFEIRNWISNSEKVVQALGGKVNKIDKDLNVNVDLELSNEKVLGMWWSTSTDTFTYSLKYNKMNAEILYGKRCPTKREVLRILMKLYDPLGLIANFLIYLKILLQDIWKSLVDWDDEINAEQYKRWLTWVSILPQVENIEIQRCYTFSSSVNREKIQLHIFVDASENAYAAVAYFRIGDDDEIECSLIGSKTRVAPIKMLSIPRLELQAALLGTRLATSIEANHSIKIGERFFWSDSKTVLCWLNSDQRKFRQFVAFRIGEILESTEVKEWQWLPTKQNVADEATKWQKIPDFSSKSRWFIGPDFLHLPKSQWPKYELEIIPTNEEMRPHLTHNFVILQNIIEPERFSKWSRLVRALCYTYRFINNINVKKVKINGPISQIEYLQAENYLYRQAQKDEYYDEVLLLTKNKLLSDYEKLQIEKSSKIYNQSPYLDEFGVLRVRGRIDASMDVQIATKRPVILPVKNYITQLIIRMYHDKYHHHNNETVVNEIRQMYSIPKLRIAVKKEKRSCQLCKNKNAVPRPPEMANLPAARLASFTRPFSYIGIDYFGPILITSGRRTEKRWGMLITCLTIRAIHIEIAHYLTTDSCIICLRNFMARRGTPIQIYSDNGTNFRGADRELQMAMDKINQTKMAEEFTTNKTQWIFIPPASPHMGGSWERLVQSVKKTLYQIMPTRNPSDELLRSMLMEVENVVNSRPLTYVPIDDECQEALTPNHFLLGSSSGLKPLGEFTDDNKILKNNWMMSQRYADKFWTRWVREYLPTLTRRSKWFHPVKPIEEGDIVIIVDDNCTRNVWQKGKIIKVKKSQDGQVRSATVQTSTGIYERPAVKLAVLDVKAKIGGKPTEDVIVIPGGSVTAGDGLTYETAE